MKTLYKHEMKSNWKSLLLWTICVGGICFACLLLYSGMEDSMADMAESFASMGAFADAFGLNQLSIATLIGFYATEVGTIHSLGGAMFAGMLGTAILSKEEDGHTSEFLYTLPISRRKAVTAKWLTLASCILIFNVCCVVLYLLGFAMLGENIEAEHFVLYHGMQLLMQLELGSICFLISACVKKNKFGAGFGVVLLLYALDMLARIVPDLEKVSIITPFAYANAADIFSGGGLEAGAFILGMAVLLTVLTGSFMVYERKDLAA